MTGEPSVMLTIDLNNPNLNVEETEAIVQNLIAQIRDLDEIEAVDFDCAYQKAQESLKG